MKKVKRVLGIFLAVVIMVTAMAPLYANAASIDLEAYAKRITALPNNANYSSTNSAHAANIAEYNAVRAIWLTLTDAEKSQLGLDAQRAMLDRSARYYAAQNGFTLSSSTYARAHAGVIELGIPNDDMIEASEIAQIFYGQVEVPGTGVKLSTSLAMNETTNPENAEAFLIALDIYESAPDSVKEAIAPFCGSNGYLSPGAGTAVTTAALIQIMQVYGKYVYDNDLDPEGTTSSAAGGRWAFAHIELPPDYDALRNLLLEAVPFLLEYGLTYTYDEDAYNDVLARYNALGSYENKIIDSYFNNIAVARVYMPITGTYNNAVSALNLKKYFVAVGVAAYVNPMIEAFDPDDFDNDVLREIKVRYDSITDSGARGAYIPAAIQTKYGQIKGLYTPVVKQEFNEEKPDTSSYVKTDVSYIVPGGKPILNASFDTLSDLVAQLLGSVAGGVGDMLYTNELIGTVVGLMSTFDIPSEAMLIGINLKPYWVAQALTEPEYAAARAYYLDLAWSWDGYDPSVIDWGFEDGDREGFVNAFTAGIRLLSKLLMNYGNFRDNPNGTYGDYEYGIYETTLVPALEALGCPNIMSTEDFIAATASAPVDSQKGDVLIKAILNPVLDLLEDVLSDPLPKILDLLPNLAYGITTGAFDNLFSWVLNVAGFKLKVLPVNNFDELIDMLVGSTGLNLPELNWEEIAGLGELKNDKLSASNRNMYTTYVEADRADVIAYVVNYLGLVLQDKTNANIIADMITNAIGLPVTVSDLTTLITACAKGDALGAIEASTDFIATLIENLGPIVIKVPSGLSAFFAKIVAFFQSIIAFFTNLFS